MTGPESAESNLSPSTFKLAREIADKIIEHAEADHPIEACGVVAGAQGGGAATRWIPLVNAADSEVFYELASKDLLGLYRELDRKAEEIVVVYHSHTATHAYPSQTDVRLASEPNAHYVLVSTPELTDRGPKWTPGAELRSFRIVNGQIAEESIELI